VQTWIELPFADGRYLFRLGLAQIAEIERKCDAGIGKVYARTIAGRHGFQAGDALPEQGEYRLPELIEVIRQGLVGGASGIVDGADIRVSAPRANELVDRYIAQATDQRLAMSETWALAFMILHALIEGYDPPKKEEPAGGPAT
jgi:hypothetical protein